MIDPNRSFSDHDAVFAQLEAALDTTPGGQDRIAKGDRLLTDLDPNAPGNGLCAWLQTLIGDAANTTQTRTEFSFQFDLPQFENTFGFPVVISAPGQLNGSIVNDVTDFLSIGVKA